MDERIANEIEKAAERLEMSVEETTQKYMEICEQNNLDPTNDVLLGRSLFRQWFSGAYAYKDAPATESTGNSLIKKASGFFISVNEPLDMGARMIENIVSNYKMDANKVFSEGKVAIAVAGDEGFTIRRYYNGEEQTVVKEGLPESAVEIDTGNYIIPLDSIPKYGMRDNPTYGKPLPASQVRMQAVFLGEVDGERGMYYFSYKGEFAKQFTPTTFKFCHFDCIPDSNNKDRIYGFKQGTYESLVYNSELSEENQMEEPSISDMQNYTMEVAMENYSPLIDLDRYHSTAGNKSYAERFVITDGSVISIDATPNRVGNRRLSITDVNSDYNYDNAGWAGTTCWIPPHIDIDFGINSTILVVARTSQGRNDDGSLREVSLNVSGILCINNMGVVVESFVAEEEDLDWF
tara:strand:- start:1440 stop:2657 length:1218 start_codon:yes stop_codon:yes gene_type:complete